MKRRLCLSLWKLLTLSLKLLILSLKLSCVLCHHSCSVLCPFDDPVLAMVASEVIIFNPFNAVLAVFAIYAMIAIGLVAFFNSSIRVLLQSTHLGGFCSLIDSNWLIYIPSKTCSSSICLRKSPISQHIFWMTFWFQSFDFAFSTLQQQIFFMAAWFFLCILSFDSLWNSSRLSTSQTSNQGLAYEN